MLCLKYNSKIEKYFQKNKKRKTKKVKNKERDTIMKKIIIIALALVFIILLFYFRTASQADKKIESATTSTRQNMTQQNSISGSINSSSFATGSAIPKKYTCDGRNTSPELNWHFNTSDAIKSYVLIVDDPDAQPVVGHTVVHWSLLLPPSITQLPADISSKDQAAITTLDQYIKPLKSTYKTDYYQGPCPPATAEVHTYNFTIFALSASVEPIYQLIHNKTYTAEEFKRDMGAYILASALLQGTYSRE